MTNHRVIGIGETVLDILFKDDQPQKAVPGGSTFNSIVSLGRAGVNCVMVTEVGGDHVGDMICRFLNENGVSSEYVFRRGHVKSPISLAFLDEHNDAYPVQPIETVSTVGAGDNFNAGYIYAKLQGMNDQAARIAMAQRWSQDVCRQLGNNISDALVASLHNS